ncbi:hypothetical protein ACJMK2_008772, partial [Sinanodonta woodiana]
VGEEKDLNDHVVSIPVLIVTGAVTGAFGVTSIAIVIVMSKIRGNLSQQHN